ncbi:MAG: LysM peptidoglycan-binding domain-containing protein [Burkholderiaceae bacterium]
MKKFSTAALILAFGSACALGVSANAYAAKKTSCEFLPNAPDSHTVVRGDTLWDISGKFLQNPWCWPEVWGLNKEQIKNPHWIYPKQIVYFDRATGRLRLGNATGDAVPSKIEESSDTIHLSPRMRIEGLGQEAIPAIASKDIEQFLSQPLVIDQDELKNTPRIVQADEGHVYLGKNEKAYVIGNLNGGTSFQVFHPGKALIDPATKKLLAYEAVYLGTVKVQREAKSPNEAHVVTVISSKEEMGVGDRLLPVPPTPILNYVPHPPESQVDARIVSIYGGVTQAGQHQVVSINRGKNQGLDIGTTLDLTHFGNTIVDPANKKNLIKLPDQKYGTLFIFRVFNNVSYGLIMQVTDVVEVGDIARSPE